MRPPKRLIGDAVPSRKAALALAKAHGCTIEPVRRTGEVRVVPPWPGPTIRINNRRVDCPKELLALIRQAEARGPKT